ncbi:MAG: ATP-binding protein [Novosphingobium sp.]
MIGPIVNSDRSCNGDVFSISLPVRISSVEDGRLALMSYLEPFALDDRVINRIEVVLEELLSNVVRHAEGADKLSIEAECADHAVRLAIEDNGVAFNPLVASEPEPFADLENATLGRLGIPLIRRLSQSVSYDRIGPVNRVSAVITAG